MNLTNFLKQTDALTAQYSTSQLASFIHEIGRQLFSMEILCMGEYDEEDFSLRDMVYHELLDCDLVRLCLDAAYCACCAVPLEKRPEMLYEIISGAKQAE